MRLAALAVLAASLLVGCDPAGSGATGTGRDAGGGGGGDGGGSERPDDRGPPVPWSDEMQPLADASNAFACDLYAKLREQDGNLFLSPYSIHTALAMTATWAKGATREQMVKVLRLPADEAKALASGDLGRFYAAGGKEYELSVANALWGQKGLAWQPEFRKVQRERFGAGFNEADFASNPDGERGRINRWVEEKTRDRIKGLLQPGDVTPMTRMVLANAIYFKGKWAAEFKKDATKDAPFRLAGGGTATAPLMHRQGSYAYAEGDGFQVLSLPYKGGDLGLVVVLPREADGLPAVEKQLTAGALAGWMKKLTAEEVQVWLPRFRTEQRFVPNAPLQALGMVDAFDPDKADFKGMADSPLHVSKVVHKAFVDVNEEGTEAAAATAVVTNAPAAVPVRPKPKVFKADHPFLFLICDLRHGTVLFMGRMANPR